MSSNVMRFGAKRVFLDASPKPTKHDTLRPISVQEIRDSHTKSRKVSMSNARTRAYIDLYGILFFLNDDVSFLAVGDKTVLYSLIEAGVLDHDPRTNLISRTQRVPLLEGSGPVHREPDGRTYQARVIDEG